MKVSLPGSVFFVCWTLIVLTFPLDDTDYFWHLETGRWIVENGWRLPAADPFSHTASQSSQPFKVYGWLFDVAQYLAFRAGDAVLLKLFFGTIVAVFLAVLYWFSRLYAESSIRALILTALVGLACAPFLTARPTLATLLGFAFVCLSLFKYRTTRNRVWLLTLPPVFCLWANLHPGFMAGLALVALVVATDFLDRVLPLRGSASSEAQFRLGAGVALFGVCVAATTLNPDGYQLLVNLKGKVASDSASVIMEWQSPNFNEFYGKAFLVLIMAWLMMLGLSRRVVSWFDLLFPMSLIVLALSSVRHLPLAVVALTVSMARIQRSFTWPSLHWKGVNLGQSSLVRALISERGEPSSVIQIILIFSVLAITPLFYSKVAEKEARTIAEYYPERAVRFITQNGLDGHLFNHYHHGGYLIHTLGPQRPVFVDGRYNPFVGRVLDDYLSIMKVGHDWSQRIEPYQISVAIIEKPNEGIGFVMRSSGLFRMVFEDDRFAVMIHRDVDRPDLLDVEVVNGY
jgi:hypothetical protein